MPSTTWADRCASRGIRRRRCRSWRRGCGSPTRRRLCGASWKQLAAPRADRLERLLPSGGGRFLAARESLDQLVEAQLLEALAHGLELCGAPLHELAAFPDQIKGLAQAGFPGIKAFDDHLDPV